MSRASLIAWSLLAGSVFAAEPAFDTLIAHRGESMDAPENTLPAYRMAVERGFGFECDVYLSSDGRVFTFHDTTLTRTTGGAQTVTTDCAQSQRDAYARRQAVDAAVAAARADGHRYEPRDYVQDGLILHLDGIRNSGPGGRTTAAR